MIGQTVSHYRIIEKLGEGGMGVVYLAEDTHLARQVAIKFLSSMDHHYRARFIREARAVSGLSHSNIATVHDYGETSSGQPYIVMEYVKGKSLSDALAEGLTLARSVEIVSEVAAALSEAHQNNIVHRDIKPSNIIITERGHVKVLDFGLVKNLAEQSTSGIDFEAQTMYSTQTRSDVIVGTPLYLSPEQATGKPVDGRSDLFALGSVLYECITGQSAFSGASVLEIGAQVIHVTPVLPSKINPRIPTELDRITMKALQKQLDKRYQSADEMVHDLQTLAPRLADDTSLIAGRGGRSLAGNARRTAGAFNSITTSLRRERFSFTGIITAVVLTSIAIWAAYHWWPRSYYQPSSAALSWYERGTDGLRNGAYYQGSKALEQAIAIDKDFALAHARLAQAWTELDYTDRAKDELLLASTLAGNRSSLSPRDALYLDAITATVRRDFDTAVKAYSEITKLAPDDSQVYVDLGYALENGDKVDQALENYQKAIGLNNQQYATAYLRSGIVYSRKQDMNKATEMYDKAEQLYRAGSNNEGVTEVLLKRGILYREKGRYEEAKRQFQDALESATALGNEAQEISALIDLSYLQSTLGVTQEAEKYAQQAVSFSRDKHLENLAAGGLIELGNSFSTRGDYEGAEKYYRQAIDLAQANKGRRREAVGLLNLGALYITQLKTDDGLTMVQQALKFFEQGNYPRDASLCYTHIARGNRRKGNYEVALTALNKKLQIAQQSNSQRAVADCNVELGAVLFEQENFPAALDHYSKAHDIYASLKSQIGSVFSQANRGNILWRLGRYEDSSASVAEVSTAASTTANTYKQLSPVMRLLEAEALLSRKNLSEARIKTNEAIALAGSQYRDVVIEAKSVLGLIQALAGNSRDASQLCAEAVKLATDAGDASLLSKTMLFQAEAALQTGDAKMAQSVALQAQPRFALATQLESGWRASIIASQASERLGEKDQAQSQLEQARAKLSQLEQQWGSEAFNSYKSRPDIQVLTKNLVR